MAGVRNRFRRLKVSLSSRNSTGMSVSSFPSLRAGFSEGKSPYKPLPNTGDWVRILKLQPGQEDDPLKAELIAVELDNAPAYEAISYVWGDKFGTIPFHLGNNHVNITKSLDEALRRIRSPTRERVLWCDAVCIDQSDDLERGRQVNIMGRIFQGASRVLIWLGEDDGRVEEAISLMLETTKYFDAAEGVYRDIQDVPPPKPDSTIWSKNRWEAVRMFFERPWFSRVWVLQESGLATTATALIGKFSIPWSDVIEFILISFYRLDLAALTRAVTGGSMIDAFNFVWSTYGNDVTWRTERHWLRYFSSLYMNTPHSHFYNTMITSYRFEATDGRDHVYAFLGHPSARLQNGTEMVVNADYTISQDELFAKVATALYKDMGSLVLLSAARQTPETLEDDSKPTWVPQWDKTVRSVLMTSRPGHIRFYDADYYDKTKDDYTAEFIHPTFSKSPFPTKFHVKGIVLTSIYHHTEFIEAADLVDVTEMDEEKNAKGWLNPIENAWRYIVPEKDETDFPPCPYPDKKLAFSVTTVAGLDEFDERTTKRVDSHDTGFKAYLEEHCSKAIMEAMFPGDHQYPDYLTQDMIIDEERNFNLTAQRYCHNRKFFVTKTGHYGIGPNLLNKQDLIVILYGACVPFAVRRTDKVGHYKVVGETYVHGFMNGEAVKMMERGEGDLKLEDVYLV